MSMNPVFTIEGAMKHLQHALPSDKTQARLDAMHILSECYAALVDEHREERPDFTPEWMKQYKRNAALSNPRRG